MESETGLREELEEILVRLEALRVSVESSNFDANFAGARFNNCLTTAGSSLKAAQAVLREERERIG